MPMVFGRLVPEKILIMNTFNNNKSTTEKGKGENKCNFNSSLISVIYLQCHRIFCTHVFVYLFQLLVRFELGNQWLTQIMTFF